MARPRPTGQSPWDVKKVGHLYRRAAFGATWAELEAGVKDGPEKTIDRLLKPPRDQKALDREMKVRWRWVTSPEQRLPDTAEVLAAAKAVDKAPRKAARKPAARKSKRT